MKEKLTDLLAFFSFVGTIIGAGIFAIPYAISKSGIFPAIFWFFALGLIVLLLHLMFGKVVFFGPKDHRLVGFAEIYLGKKGKKILTPFTVFGTWGALLAYIILLGIFLNLIFPKISSFFGSLIFWFLISLFITLGIRSIALVELLINFSFISALAIISFFLIPKFNFSNFLFFEKKFLFFPYGILFFSLIGWNAIAEIFSILKQKENLTKIIIFGVLFSIFFYLIFGFLIAGVSGNKTSQDAFSGLVGLLGKKMLFFGGIFGILTILSSSLILGNYLKNTFFYDLKLPYFLASFFSFFPPFLLFLFFPREFVGVISIVGILVGAVEGTFIVLIFKALLKRQKKLKRIKSFLLSCLIFFIIFAGLTELIFKII